MKYPESRTHVERYAFVVDTTTGPDPREMVAYMTGEVDEDVDEDLARTADIALRKTAPRARRWLRRHVARVADEHGHERPADTYPTPGWFNDGMGTCHREGTDPAVVQAAHHEATRAYYEPLAKQSEARAAAANSQDVADGWLKNAARHREQIANAKAGHYPAYLSVACWLDKAPPPHVIAVLVARAAAYAAEHGIEVTGYHVVKQLAVVRWRVVTA